MRLPSNILPEVAPSSDAEPTRPTTLVEGPLCLACGGPTIVSNSMPPHAPRADCPKCGTWRWLWTPTPRGGPSK